MMKIQILKNNIISDLLLKDLNNLLSDSFKITESESRSIDQKVDEWLDVKILCDRLTSGAALALGYIEDKLVSAAFIDKLNDVTYLDGNKYDLIFLCVNSSHQNKGYGKEILLYIEKEAKNLVQNLYGWIHMLICIDYTNFI